LSAAGSPAAELDRAAVAAVDSAGMLSDLLDLPNQLRDAIWRVDTAQLSAPESCDGLVVAGMGSAASGGELARAALGEHACKPLLVARGYELPPWTTPETLVMCTSYTGDTEETLATYEAAEVLGCQRIVATTGGQLAELARRDGVPVVPLPAAYQARSAIAYSTVIALEAAAVAGVGPGLRMDLDVAGNHLEERIAAWGPDAPADALPKELARALHGTVPLIAGAQLTAPIAYRWKCQLNENAKIPSSAHELPELDHNELVGWEGAADLGRFSAVFLDDRDLHPRLRRRIELTRELVAPSAASTHTIESEGESRIERILSLVLLGDLVSVYLATLRGVDPTPTASIDALKASLAAETA